MTQYEYYIEMHCLCEDAARFFNQQKDNNMKEFYSMSATGYEVKAKKLSMDEAIRIAPEWQQKRISEQQKWVMGLK